MLKFVSNSSKRNLIALCSLGLIVLLLCAKFTFPFTTDSLFYITTADHISQGKGLVFNNFFVEVPTADVIPTLLEPPGFPILIVVLKILGIDVYTAGFLAPRICFFFLPFLFFALFRRVMSNGLALVSVFTCTFLFGIIKCSLMAWSDVPYLCFSLMTLIAVMRIVESNFKLHWSLILMAGTLAGYSFLIRYTGTSLIVSVGMSFLICLGLRVVALKDFLKAGAFFTLGVALVTVPYVVRNVLVFGTPQPFKMAAVPVSFMTYTHDYLQALSRMIFVDPSLGWVVLILLVAIVVGFIFYAKTWFKTQTKGFICALFLFNYFIVNSLFLLVCRSNNLITEINERYTIQIAWLFLSMIVVLIHHWIKKKGVGTFLIIVFILIQWMAVREHYGEQKRIEILTNKIKNHIYLLQKLPADFVVVSNVADITYCLIRRNVRMLGAYTPEYVANVLGSHRKFVVFLVKDGKFLSPFWSFLPVWEQPNGYRKLFSDSDVDVLVYP
ncbi:MAG: glycosyltransferase family 39 protein [Candidatus Omnitrophica bacterium]|nr:glycosyltransferase family 39 protein [Candidatus Omnitrophota bacterium]